MKRPQKQWTMEEAAQLLREGGIVEPTPERIEQARQILNICEEQVGLTDWNERLYPKLNDLDDVEVFTAVEKALGVRISDAVYEATDARTFSDLVLFYDEQITLIAARRAREKAKLANAPCATQTAFYLLRRRLCDAGVPYYQAHELTPTALDLRLTETQAAKFTDSLRYELDLSLWVDRVMRNGVRTGDLVTAFLITTGIAVAVVIALCTDRVSGSTVWGGLLGFFAWGLCGKAFSHIINRRSQFRFYKLHREYQTLGDVTREFVTVVQAPPQAQTASN